MAPPSAKKNQKTLFSFFQKQAAPATLATPAKSADKPAAQLGSHTFTPPGSNGKVNGTPLKSPSLSSSATKLQTPASSHNSSQLEPPSSPLTVRKRRAAAIDSEDEDEDEDEEMLDNVESEYDDSGADEDYVDEKGAEKEEHDSDEMEVEWDGEDEDAAPEEDDEEESKPKQPKQSKPSKPVHTKSAPASSSPAKPMRVEPVDGESSASRLERFTANSDYKPEPVDKKPAPAKKIKSDTPPGDERYQWLVDLRDADRNAPDHPDYDPRTIYVPPSAWTKFTPFEKQYWEIKSKLWDTVVFFKKGKFYELYENDAEIAHRQFDLKLAGGGRANMQLAGIPEMTFDYWASAFIAKGYKVARVDQKETALAKEMRDASVGKKEEKIIKRELSCILTAGTLTDETMLVDDLSQYCMAIKQDETKFAVAFVDTSTGAFYLTEFQDDEDLNHFETLVAQTRPREIVLERGNLSRMALRALKNNTSVDTLWNIAKSGTEFWDAETSLQRLAGAKYFTAEDIDDFSNYPQVLQDARSSDLLMSAFGGLLWYLASLKLDEQLVSLGNFSTYKAVQAGTSMVLDGQTLQNLEVFANTYDQGSAGTLFKLVNKCITPFGKRRLRSWVGHPLQDLLKIKARQDAVDLLLNHDELREYLEAKLVGIPDIERLLSRIHAGSLAPRDFVRVVQGLDQVAKIITWLLEQNFGVPIFDEILNGKDKLSELITPWLSAFDHAKAKDENTLVPEPGVEPDFDSTKQVITDIEKELDQYLKQYRKDFQSLAICYRDSGKELYLIEVPTKVKNIPDSWQQMAATSKVKRYWSPEVRTLVRKLQEAKETHKVEADRAQAKLYAKFNKTYYSWLDSTKAIASIDCLLSLARTSANMAVHCRPEFVESERSLLKFEELRHPCMSDSFIPNDVELGGSSANFSLLTGANAAGKSTVLRMTGLAVIMAQLGCHVPARSARLTSVDRIMTRLGASDNIFAGKSTFHVELSETQRILSEATSRSLVVIDELGRGGSSSDGFAIAESVLHQLATHLGCLGFFATHYGTLMDSFTLHPEVRPQRMSILVDEESREVTFLYKLENGRSEGSFGMNVALMCGVSKDIVDAAEMAAKEYEHTQRLVKKGFQGVPLGLQSDIIHSLNNLPNQRAVDIMTQISVKL